MISKYSLNRLIQSISSCI